MSIDCDHLLLININKIQVKYTELGQIQSIFHSVFQLVKFQFGTVCYFKLNND